jgi:hypothetical protein
VTVVIEPKFIRASSAVWVVGSPENW